MARFKWLVLLLLIPALCGFDTRNPFRTRGPFKSFDFAAGAVVQGACTDGVDCFCDIVTDSNQIHCEDFENLDYYTNTSNDWVAGGVTNNWRGGDSRWFLDYGGTQAGGWSLGKPASPIIGSTCVNTGQGGSCPANREWCSEAQGDIVIGTPGTNIDCWQGNSGASVDIQRSGDFDEEISTLTLSNGSGESGDVGAGRAHLAMRLGANSTGGKLGNVSFTKKTEIGVTEAVAFASNVFTSGIATSYWKGPEWSGNGLGGGYEEWWMYGNMKDVGSDATFPFRNNLWVTSQSACNTAKAAAIAHVGQLGSCSSNGQLYFGASNGTSVGTYDQETDWPLGTWACVQGHIVWSGGFVTIKVWHNEELIIWISNLDASILRNNDGYSNMAFNDYANYNAGQGVGPSTVTSYRYHDNLEITNGPPIDCSAIGF